MFHPTPDNLRAIYDMLRSVSPFRGWRLPPGEKVEFHVIRDPNAFAHHVVQGKGLPEIIQVSARTNKTLTGTVATMAHEMIHVYEHKRKQKRAHGKSFQRHADAICKRLGFDRGTF